ncbi:ECF transporter S component [Sporomusa aerivorans]|uniref:ECF transporter S component n=1 Tax=Sporomusa aerivorans TaxID=204936 RepID=UPI00352B9538
MFKKRSLAVRDIVFSGVLAAMCAIATSFKIPFGVGAMVHLGTAFLYTVGICFGGVYAGLAGAIGSAFYDLIMGFSPYTLWSFVIKGIAGLIVGVVAKGMWPAPVRPGEGRNWIWRAVLGCVLAAAWTLGGYIVAWWQVTGSLAIAFANMPGSLLTSGVGLIIAMILSPKLRKNVNQ